MFGKGPIRPLFLFWWIKLKILLQRVLEASVRVDHKLVGSIESGLLLLVGFSREDEKINLQRVVSKVTNLRVFEDSSGKLQNSIIETGGQVLVVPQFTLYANTKRGRRPDFVEAMLPSIATKIFEEFLNQFESDFSGVIQKGVFGADMKVSLVNDGPFTLMLEF